jgi:16S rRNA (guanine966-N2)-methyltransferase
MPDGGRVIAGTARGFRLEGARPGTRPLSDRVKQALFASLETEGALDNAFLDLYAGTGAAGFEALSRGATQATFVERDARACDLIRANLVRAQLVGGEVVRANVLTFLSTGRKESGARYQATLVDPPYDEPLVAPTMALLGDPALDWLTDGAIVVAKHFWRDTPAEQIGTLRLERQRRFGETMLTFYRQTGIEPGTLPE